jgi:hypothetical protein
MTRAGCERTSTIDDIPEIIGDEQDRVAVPMQGHVSGRPERIGVHGEAAPTLCCLVRGLELPVSLSYPHVDHG